MPTYKLPTATIETLKHRAKLIAVLRSVFDDAGFFEVETPILSSDIVIDAWLEPFVTQWVQDSKHWQQQGRDRYLQTSPEFAMKRLIAAGADSIYQICKVFRNGELGARHNPEFTMLEWYRRGDDLNLLMNFTESMVRQLFCASAELPGSNDMARQRALRVLQPEGFERLRYQDAFLTYTDCPVLTCHVGELRSLADRQGLSAPTGLGDDDRDGWLNFLLAELIEPRLGRDRPTFLTNYPASQAALARLAPDGMTAERFELYIDGIELSNGYDELTDARVLRERMNQQAAVRSSEGLRRLPMTSQLLAAMDAGDLPPCSGNALGVDRLLMLALGQQDLAGVIPFPFEIA